MGIFSKLHPIQRNVSWWRGNQPAGQKLGYYPAVLASYGRFVFGKSRSIKYLGNDFKYDTLVAPLSLMYYPEEIFKKVLQNTDGKPIKHVLDIGGNIGQFAGTMISLNPELKHIDIFEPNPDVISNLEYNLSWTNKKSIHNFGVGEPGKHTMFASSTGTSTGSLIKENAGDNHVSSKEIELVNDIPKITGRKSYDLIVIDVEGYEFDAVKNLNGLTTRYLFIELTGYGKKLSYKHSDLFAEIKDKLGDFQLVQVSEHSRNATTFYMLLEFV